MTTLSVSVSPQSSSTPYTISVSPSSYTLGSSGGTITPVVKVLQNGSPVSGVSVTISNSQLGLSESGITDSNGNASIQLIIPGNTTSQTETYIFGIAAQQSSSSGSGSSGNALGPGLYELEYAGTYGPIGNSSSDPKIGTGTATVTDGAAVGVYVSAPYYLSSQGDYYVLVGSHMLVLHAGLASFSQNDGNFLIV
ncbi:MAG: hypothetical protein M1459_01075 [Patescibacteria group bacterium]|nr:hypothetical protein [Patescibacteria group bacterium]